MPGAQHEITKPTVVLGRSREADVRVADVNVSRRHAELRQEGAGYWIVDLGSTNGLERQRQAHRPRARARRRSHHDGLDGDRVRALAAVVTLLALETDETLLILKIAFLVLLYGFIVLVVRSATKGMQQAPQESIVLGAAEAAALRAEHGLTPGAPARRVEPGAARRARPSRSLRPTVVGRDAQSGIRLDRDEFASGRHARIEPRPDGAWVDDLGSTNGTFLNGKRLKRAKLAKAGDVIKIGATELQVQS